MANLPVRIREDLADGPRSHPSATSESESVNCSSPPNSCANASVARTSGDSATDPSSENPPPERGIRSREADSDTLSIRGDSTTDPSSENPPTEGGIRPTEADTDTESPNVSVARQISAANPINDGETNSAPAGVGKNRDSMRSETGESSEEESPIRNIRG